MTKNTNLIEPLNYFDVKNILQAMKENLFMIRESRVIEVMKGLEKQYTPSRIPTLSESLSIVFHELENINKFMLLYHQDIIKALRTLLGYDHD